MKIAVLVIGRMGFPMARRLCEAGHQVQAWNRSRAKAQSLAATGVTAPSPEARRVRVARVVSRVAGA